MKLAIIFLALSAFAADAPAPPVPVITTEHQAAFERARANEAESRAVHDADTANLQAAYASVAADCGKDAHPERPDRDKPVVCVANPPKPDDKK